jgi:hypothetical protein
LVAEASFDQTVVAAYAPEAARLVKNFKNHHRVCPWSARLRFDGAPRGAQSDGWVPLRICTYWVPRRGRRDLPKEHSGTHVPRLWVKGAVTQ